MALMTLMTLMALMNLITLTSLAAFDISRMTYSVISLAFTALALDI